MHRFVRCGAVALAVVMTLSAAAPRALARQYTLTPIPLGEFEAVLPDDLNNAGQATGWRIRSGGGPEAMHGYVWSAAGGLTDLGAGVLPQSINDRGAVVGRVLNGEPFIWTPAQGVRLLSSLPGGAPFRDAEADDINASGQVLGSTNARAFVYNPDGTVRTLPLPVASDGQPLAMVQASSLTDAGDALGRLYFSNGGDNATFRGVVWAAAGGIRLLDDIPGGHLWSEAYAMNTRGQIAGSGMNDVGQRAVVWTPDGQPIDLGLLPGGTFSGTSGINDAGEVVGWSGGGDSVSWHSFLWTESEGLQDLNNLVDASGAGWTLNTAYGINNAGQILTSAWVDGVYRTAVLTPVPEPSALGLLSVAGLLALRRRRRTPVVD